MQRSPRPTWLLPAVALLAGVAVLAGALRSEPPAPAPEPPMPAPAPPEPVVEAPAPPVMPIPPPPPVAPPPADCVTDPVLGCLRRIPGRRFLLMESEVTQAMWQRVMGVNPSANEGCPDCPVEQVTGEDAVAFAKKVSRITGFRYRLPTEAEWEYAARGGEDFEYSGSDNIDAVAWYGRNSGISPRPVCQKQRNAYGLCDMSGNVWEWTATVDGSRRVFRGGSWHSPADLARVSSRDWWSPSDRLAFQGVRLVRSP